ncbi:guanine nucleotide binding protein, alpha subunit [Mycena rebaudengoi]|nr:guanine nucleotide binding protein, alpha subunit [Mycena rebaudengoi]
MRPPEGETAEEAAVRMAREEDARAVSLAIDASISKERQARRKKRPVRLLLLGQSESGKSTTLRQFQRLYTPTAFRAERILWRAVIQMNIVRSVRRILDALAPRTKGTTTRHNSNASRAPSNININAIASSSRDAISDFAVDSDGDLSAYYPESDQGYTTPPPLPSPSQNMSAAALHHLAMMGGSSPQLSPSSQQQQHNFAYAPPQLLSERERERAAYDTHRTRLLPLRHVEALLIARLVPAGEGGVAFAGSGSSTNGGGDMRGYTSRSNGSGEPDEDGEGSEREVGRGEIFVRPGNRWKVPALLPALAASLAPHASNAHPPINDEAQTVLNACAPAIRELWSDRHVRGVLKRRKVRVEEGPGFFLNDLDRVTSLDYLPNDDDVLRARLKTVGVSEYVFEMEVSAGRETGTEWRIVDVGGSRSQLTEGRAAMWAPFFDDVNAIIFLAPISGFDQVLSEDKTVNRLEDSVLLWKSVCSNKLLANVDLVLFLNKCDILERKLNSGVRLARYVRSYADRENTFDAVSQYLRGKFSAIHREHSPNPRKFYASARLSLLDTTTTAGIIASVRDMVVRVHLKQSKLM